ncbi:MAG: hypothetical protein ACFB21_05285 [Opitutales bacterium]
MPRLFFLILLFALCAAGAEVRTWTNHAGQTIQAEYLSQNGGSVTLLRYPDRQQFTFPVASLSPADQQWLASQAPLGSDGIFIAVGNGLHRMSSNDGREWTNHVYKGKPGHDQNDLKDIAFGNDSVVTVGGFSRSNILTTTDGVAWHKNDFNIGVLSGVIFHEGYFYVFGEGARTARSPDGMTWEAYGDGNLREDFLEPEAERLGEDKPIKSNIRQWRFAQGRFVGTGDNSIIATTVDFNDWDYQRLEPRERLFVETNGRTFVAHGRESVQYSPDGLTWTEVTPDDLGDGRINSLVFDGERYVLNNSRDVGWESSDGEVWARIADASFPDFIASLRPGLYYSFKNYWQYTEEFKVSTDGGKTWESTNIPEPVGVTNIIFAPGFASF